MTSLIRPERPETQPSRTDFELVIFDCDGVLVDSEAISVRVDQRVLADLGWELELEEIVERFVGRSEASFIATIEQHLGIELAAGWDRKYEPWYRTAFERDLVAVDGIVEALDQLTLPHCVASSGSHGKMQRTLARRICCPALKAGFSAPPRSPAASRPRISSSMLPLRSELPRNAASSSRTASTECRRHGQRECMSWFTPGASRRRSAWPVRVPPFLPICGSCRNSLLPAAAPLRPDPFG